MKNILIIDTETTGLDTENGQVLEIAAIFYNIETRCIISQVSTLLYAEENPAFAINKIKVEACKETVPQIQIDALSLVKQMMMDCDALVAHNAAFDKKWIETIALLQPISRIKKWICTKNDVTWPVRKGTPLNLIQICVDLAVPIVDAHRALSDCTLLVGALNKIDDLQAFLDESAKGKVTVFARLDYDHRQLAKDYGFHWDNLRKVWFARLAEEKIQELPFLVTTS